jgi:hypothetical protein
LAPSKEPNLQPNFFNKTTSVGMLFEQGSALFGVSRQVKPVNNKRREAGASHQQMVRLWTINSSFWGIIINLIFRKE